MIAPGVTVRLRIGVPESGFVVELDDDQALVQWRKSQSWEAVSDLVPLS